MVKYTDMIKSKSGINGQFLVEVAKKLDSGTSIKGGPTSPIAASYKGEHGPNKALYEAIVEESLKPASVTDLDTTMAEVNRISPMVDSHATRLDTKSQRLDKIERDSRQLAQAISDIYDMLQETSKQHAGDLHFAGNRLYLKTHEGIIMGNGVEISGATNPDVPLTSLTVNPQNVNLQPGGSRQLSVSYVPSNTTQIGVTYTSSNRNAVEVTSSGMLTAVASGSSVITVRSSKNTNISKTVNVNVATQDLLVTAISPNETTKDLMIGDSFDLTWSYTPSNATSPIFNVTSSSGSVTVSNLTTTSKRLTAVATGLTTITITETKSGVSTTMLVNVAGDNVIDFDMNGATATYDSDTGVMTATSVPTAYYPVFLKDGQGNMARKFTISGKLITKAASVYVIIAKHPTNDTYLAVTLGGWKVGSLGDGKISKWYWLGETTGTVNNSLSGSDKSVGATVTFELEDDKLIVRGDKGYYEFNFNDIADDTTRNACLNNKEFGFFLQKNTLPNVYEVIG